MIWDFQKYRSDIAILDEYGMSLTYGGLYEEGRCLQEAIGRRCLAFVLCRNETGALVGYTGMLNGGIVPVLLNSQLDRSLLDNLLKAYYPAFLWVPEDMREQFPEMGLIFSSNRYCLLKTGYPEAYPMHQDLALLLTTSGSTGSPKLVRQSYKNVLVNAQAIAEYLALTEAERPITTLPMNYTYGLSIINSHLLVGAMLLVTDKSLAQKEFWAFFQEKGATSFGGVPYTYEMLDRMRFQRKDLPSLRTMTQAGGKLTPELHKKFAEYAKETHKKFVVMYGQCEATARMGYLPAERAIEKYGSMGIAIPGGRFHLIDEAGTVITEPGITGELVYEGPNVTLGYAERGEDLVKGDERNGVLQTGDMAKFDSDGYYYITGRKKRFLKIYGNRVNLDEVDCLVKEKFHHMPCASAGVDDHMVLFITDGGLVEKVEKYVSRTLKLNPAAIQVIAIEEIPKNDAGKIRYTELEKYYSPKD